MKLTFLGTSAAEAFPAPFCECDTCNEARLRGNKNIRTRSQALVNDDLMLDFPPDAYMHILLNAIDMKKVGNILITHCHEDHLYLHDLLLRRPDWLQFDRTRQLRVWGNSSLIEKVSEWEKQDFVAKVKQSTSFVNALPFITYTAGEYHITPLLADHNPNEQCLIYYIEHRQQGLLYAHDTGYFPDETWAWLVGKPLDIVSLDCNNMMQPGSQNHMGLDCCIQVKQRLLSDCHCNDRTVFVLNHFSHNGAICHEEFEAAVATEGFYVSWDGYSLSV